MRFVEPMPRRLTRVAFGAAAHTLVLCGFAIIVSLFESFDTFDVPSVDEVRRASAAIVFSGSFERIDAGLQLVNSGLVRRLYISGMNPNAGLRPSSFVAQFSARNPNVIDLSRLVECCVQWDEKAENTIQNAIETRCWVRRHDTPGPLVLITSRLHMARALTALSSELRDYRLVPLPIPDSEPSTSHLRRRTLEYLKHLATIAVVHARWISFRLPVHQPFAADCPP